MPWREPAWRAQMRNRRRNLSGNRIWYCWASRVDQIHTPIPGLSFSQSGAKLAAVFNAHNYRPLCMYLGIDRTLLGPTRTGCRFIHEGSTESNSVGGVLLLNLYRHYLEDKTLHNSAYWDMWVRYYPIDRLEEERALGPWDSFFTAAQRRLHENFNQSALAT